MRVVFVIVSLGVVLLMNACAERVTRQGETTMPSPDGCFIQVWDVASFGGVTDYINGPRSYMNLRDLPGARVWADRIKSLKTGVSARAIVYADEDFTGTSVRLMPDRDYPSLPQELSGGIQSMRIDCPAQSTGKAP
jgi:hypothetical protein